MPPRVERLSIFHPRRHNNTNQTRASARSSSTGSKRAAEKTPWTPAFVCLADTSSSKTPSSFDKQILFKAGLGVKKIKLDLEDNEQTVLDKITSNTKDASGNAMGFPQLKNSGGFEMLRCSPNCRDLLEIDSCWSAKDLRSAIGGGQGKIYLRPIQRSLSTKPLVLQIHSGVKEKCQMCDQDILVCNLRAHLYTCTAGLYSDESDEPENTTTTVTVSSTPSTTVVLGTTSSPPSTSTSISAVSGNSSRTISTSSTTSTSSTSTSSTTSTLAASGDTSILTASVDTSMASDVHPGDTSEAPQVAAVVDLTEETSNGHQSLNTVEEVVQATVSYCKTNNADHTEILRCFQQYFVKGRALDVVGEAQVNKRETNFIIVDRQNLIETAFMKYWLSLNLERPWKSNFMARYVQVFYLLFWVQSSI